ncbi:MAG: TetR/AcrR family transcriptional regulator [Desulfobacteraceae bacterium]|nr:TetR/AcrR family transcriptional regulator [Desulfobacteraceae bacterium]
MGQNEFQVVRKPKQARSQERHEKILDAAEALIIDIGIKKTSVHRIAQKANVPASSVYQYFSTIDLILVTLSERYFEKVLLLYENRLKNAKITHWQDLTDIMVSVTYEFYTTDIVGEKLFLGIDSTASVRQGAASRLTIFAEWIYQFFDNSFDLSGIDGFKEALAISVNVMDAAFVRSLSLHGKIIPAYKEEATRAVTGYIGSYLGFRLPSKQ